MGNSVQTNNNNVQQWHNQAFADMYESISAKLPSMTFWAIIFSYAATAALNVWAIHLPMYISVPLAIAIQALRFLTVFTPFLNPHGRASHLPEMIAIGASILALFELSFSIQALGTNGNEFWSIFLFGAAILVLSMILEIQFINQGKKAFGLTGVGDDKQASKGAVSTTNAQSQPAPLPQPEPDEATAYLIDLNKQLRQRLDLPLTEIDDHVFLAEVKRRNQLLKSKAGNDLAPRSDNPVMSNLGHLNGSLNSPGHP